MVWLHPLTADFRTALGAAEPPAACAVIETPAGQEAQVDYGEGPMIRDPATGKYRRSRLFVLVLGHRRKAVRLLTLHASAHIWAELHEQAFRRLGGAPRLVVLDNLREGVLRADWHYGGATHESPRAPRPRAAVKWPA